MDNKSKSIICLPGSLYDKIPWTNRQQVMTRLAKRHRVLFLEDPKYPLFQLAKVMLRIMPEQKTHKWFLRLFNPEKREDNLYILSLVRFFPVKRKLFRKLNYLLNLTNLKRVIKKYGFSNAVLWIYTPDAVDYVRRLWEEKVVYDCVDEYTAQPYYKDNFDNIELDEIELLKRADYVITSAPKLYEAKSKYNKNTYLVPNAGDYEHFSKAMRDYIPIPEDISSIPKPVIGFVGAIDEYKLDFRLIAYLADKNPNWSIVLIGPVGQAERGTDIKEFKKRENVYLLGQKDYKLMPNYIKVFDVCIIPYVRNEYTEGCLPLKFFEFLATGKPVVISGLPALEQFNGVVKIANMPDDFVSVVKDSLQNDSEEERELRLATARENTWDKKVDKLEEIVLKETYASNR